MGAEELGKLLRTMKGLGTMEDQYSKTLTPEEIPDAKFRLSKLEESIASSTPQNSCGTALHRMGKRVRLMRAQIKRSEKDASAL